MCFLYVQYIQYIQYISNASNIFYIFSTFCHDIIFVFVIFPVQNFFLPPYNICLSLVAETDFEFFWNNYMTLHGGWWKLYDFVNSVTSSLTKVEKKSMNKLIIVLIAYSITVQSILWCLDDFQILSRSSSACFFINTIHAKPHIHVLRKYDLSSAHQLPLYHVEYFRMMSAPKQSLLKLQSAK